MKLISLPVGGFALVVFSTLIALSNGAWGQDSVAAANLAAAKEISVASGRPIFAIAGRST